jgi:hypothetical protein
LYVGLPWDVRKYFRDFSIEKRMADIAVDSAVHRFERASLNVARERWMLFVYSLTCTYICEV